MDVNTFFSDQDGALLLKLIIAHIIVDFIFQTKTSILSKSTKGMLSVNFWVHIALVAALSTLAILGHFNWYSILLITLTHAIIDLIKIKIESNFDKKEQQHLKKYTYIADQALHLLFILLAWLIIIDGWTAFSAWMMILYTHYEFLLLITGYLIVIGPVTYLIKFLTIRWNKEIAAPDNSLDDAGKTIGILERIIVLTLIYASQFTAIGFLITAKSILRLIDKPEYPEGTTPEQKIFSTRKHTEYVLIGTFLSLSIAILTGLIIKELMVL